MGSSRLAVIRAALRGRGGDPTTGPIDRAILFLVVPMVLEMAMESVFAITDIFFVSRLGADAAADATVQAIALGLITALVLGIAGGLAAEHLLRMMGAGRSVIGVGVGYTRVLLSTNVVVLLLFLINAAFRGAGDAAIAMRVLWLANGINVVLDPCLIFGVGPFPELGVTGAAVATSIGRGSGVLLQLWMLFRGNGRLAVHARHVRINFGVM